MKKLFFAIVIFAMFLNTLYVFATSSYAKVTANALNIRSGAGTEYKVVTVAKSGEKLELISDKPKNGWYHVRTSKGKEGYASQKYLKVIPDDKTEEQETKESFNIKPYLPYILIGSIVLLLIIKIFKNNNSSGGGSSYDERMNSLPCSSAGSGCL